MMSPSYQCLSVSVAPCLRGQCRLLHSSLRNCKSFNASDYIHKGSNRTYTYTGSTTIQHIACPGSWSWYQCHAGNENGKYCTQNVGIELSNHTLWFTQLSSGCSCIHMWKVMVLNTKWIKPMTYQMYAYPAWCWALIAQCRNWLGQYQDKCVWARYRVIILAKSSPNRPAL